MKDELPEDEDIEQQVYSKFSVVQQSEFKQGMKKVLDSSIDANWAALLFYLNQLVDSISQAYRTQGRGDFPADEFQPFFIACLNAVIEKEKIKLDDQLLQRLRICLTNLQSAYFNNLGVRAYQMTQLYNALLRFSSTKNKKDYQRERADDTLEGLIYFSDQLISDVLKMSKDEDIDPVILSGVTISFPKQSVSISDNLVSFRKNRGVKSTTISRESVGEKKQFKVVTESDLLGAEPEIKFIEQNRLKFQFSEMPCFEITLDGNPEHNYCVDDSFQKSLNMDAFKQQDFLEFTESLVSILGCSADYFGVVSKLEKMYQDGDDQQKKFVLEMVKLCQGGDDQRKKFVLDMVKLYQGGSDKQKKCVQNVTKCCQDLFQEEVQTVYSVNCFVDYYSKSNVPQLMAFQNYMALSDFSCYQSAKAKNNFLQIIDLTPRPRLSRFARFFRGFTQEYREYQHVECKDRLRSSLEKFLSGKISDAALSYKLDKWVERSKPSFLSGLLHGKRKQFVSEMKSFAKEFEKESIIDRQNVSKCSTKQIATDFLREGNIVFKREIVGAKITQNKGEEEFKQRKILRYINARYKQHPDMLGKPSSFFRHCKKTLVNALGDGDISAPSA